MGQPVSESFELRNVDHFVADAVGPPGQRVFYLQAAQGSQTVTLRLEKQQVAALCEHLAAMMADLPEAVRFADATIGLREPVEAAWVVGALGVAYEQADDRILLVAEEMVVDADDNIDTDEFDDDFDDLFGDSAILGGAATARFYVPRSMVEAFVVHGLAVTSAGRPACELCGGPINPDGHLCPRLN
jgi:uncharacterized repeat protein (TIGR03847 family)